MKLCQSLGKMIQLHEKGQSPCVHSLNGDVRTLSIMFRIDSFFPSNWSANFANSSSLTLFCSASSSPTPTPSSSTPLSPPLSADDMLLMVAFLDLEWGKGPGRDSSVEIGFRP